MHLPGTEAYGWDQLDLFYGSLMKLYLRYCTEHCKFLLNVSERNFPVVMNVLPGLVEYSEKDERLSGLINDALGSIDNLLSDMVSSAGFAKVLAFVGDADSTKPFIPPYERALERCKACWFELTEYGVESGAVAQVTKELTSGTQIRKHHILAVQALNLTHYLREKESLWSLNQSKRLLPLIYSLIEKAEEEQAKERSTKKKRQVKSPDLFLFNQLGKAGRKKKAENTAGKLDVGKVYLSQETVKLVFLKGWLYHMTNDEKEYAQTQLVYEIIDKFKLSDGQSDKSKSVNRWLSEIKKPGELLKDYAGCE
ncbi:hypothetical protein [Vibrio toranzoniae]|uniref:hypothetical protein n=1 Tax=Vibrio toranzoniae TaxID=1194427 RepID=UPI003075C969